MAAIVLVLVAAASLFCWASLALTVLIDSSSFAAALLSAVFLVCVPAAACGYVVVRMSTRRDLGVAYRLWWICLPTLALGLWSFFLLLASAPII